MSNRGVISCGLCWPVRGRNSRRRAPWGWLSRPSPGCSLPERNVLWETQGEWDPLAWKVSGHSHYQHLLSQALHSVQGSAAHPGSLGSGSRKTSQGCFSRRKRLTLQKAWGFPKAWAARGKPEDCSRDPWEAPPSSWIPGWLPEWGGDTEHHLKASLERGPCAKFIAYALGHMYRLGNLHGSRNHLFVGLVVVFIILLCTLWLCVYVFPEYILSG